MRPTTFQKLETGRKYALAWKAKNATWTKSAKSKQATTKQPAQMDEAEFLEAFPKLLDDKMREEAMNLLGKPLPPMPSQELDRAGYSRWLNKIRNTYYLTRAMCAPEDEFELMRQLQEQGAREAAEVAKRLAARKSVRERASQVYQDPDIISIGLLQALYGSAIPKNIKIRALMLCLAGTMKNNAVKEWVAVQVKTNYILTRILELNKANSLANLQKIYGPEFNVEYITEHIAGSEIKCLFYLNSQLRYLHKLKNIVFLSEKA